MVSSCVLMCDGDRFRFRDNTDINLMNFKRLFSDDIMVDWLKIV